MALRVDGSARQEGSAALCPVDQCCQGPVEVPNLMGSNKDRRETYMNLLVKSEYLSMDEAHLISNEERVLICHGENIREVVGGYVLQA